MVLTKNPISYQTIQVQRRRINVLLALVVLVPIVIFARLFYLQISQHDQYVSNAKKQHWAEDTIQPKRGSIYVQDTDETLYPLATTIKLDMVYVAPIRCKDQNTTAESLAIALNMNKEEILTKFEASKYFVPIKRKLTEEESQKIKKIDDDSIGLREENWRTYPEKTLASQILGYVDDDGVGRYGLEQYYDDELSGTPGLYKAEVDSAGNKIGIGNDVSVPAIDGLDIILTINRDVQAAAEVILEKAVQKNSADRGSLIVMDPENGQILAMANYPTFDPNEFSKVTDYSIFRNSSVEDVYEPGSIFKVLTMAAGLDADKINPESTYEDTGSLTLNGYTIRNSDLKTNGMQTMTQVLEKSLNTGTSYVESLLGKELFYDYLVKFGFGISTGFESPEEATGSVSKPEEVNDHTYATMSFGQSISASPLQMISSFALVANDGKMMKPHLTLSKIIDGREKSVETREGKEIISASAAANLTKMMVSVVKNGHGTQAAVAGYEVAGKTGTAQVPKSDGTGYETGKNIGSFIGFAPAEDAKFVVLAKIDNPKGVAWAESTAAPVVGEMLGKLLNYYQIPPTQTP